MDYTSKILDQDVSTSSVSTPLYGFKTRRASFKVYVNSGRTAVWQVCSRQGHDILHIISVYYIHIIDLHTHSLHNAYTRSS